MKPFGLGPSHLVPFLLIFFYINYILYTLYTSGINVFFFVSRKTSHSVSFLSRLLNHFFYYCWSAAQKPFIKGSPCTRIKRYMFCGFSLEKNEKFIEMSIANKVSHWSRIRMCFFCCIHRGVYYFKQTKFRRFFFLPQSTRFVRPLKFRAL